MSIQKLFLLCAVSLSFFVYLLSPGIVRGQEDIDELKKNIDELQTKVVSEQSEQKTLRNAIESLNNTIRLKELQITKTSLEIKQLESDISNLISSINELEGVLGLLTPELIKSIQIQYKSGNISPLTSLLSASSFSDLVRTQRYNSTVSNHIQGLLIKVEQSRQTSEQQKKSKEAKQKEISALQITLKNQQQSLKIQQQDKQKLIEVSKNDEKEYRQQLERALAEYAAIQNVIASKNSDTKIKEVKAGDTIASIIPGASVCSTGGHVHFESVKNGVRVDPSQYLRPESVTWHDEQFSFSGSLEWPVNDPAKIYQGYGMTSFARSGFYGGQPHTGIDMVSKSSGNLIVKAVKDGSLFRGSVKCRGGNLQYVRVDHGEGFSTYYLHVNY